MLAKLAVVFLGLAVSGCGRRAVSPARAAEAPERQGQPVPKGQTQTALDAGASVSGPEARPDGTLLYRVRSPLQRGSTGSPRPEPVEGRGATLVRILLPKGLGSPETRRVLFVLPVEAGTATRWGDPLRAVTAAQVADRFGFVVVLPTFSDLPWYCDHATDPQIRQESYLLNAVVPLVARLYPHEARRRALLGFSKSGWGAFSLILRHPDAFGAAAAWDAPMMMSRPGFGMDKIAGTLENFERYRVARLLEACPESVRRAKRLGLFGYGNFRKDTQAAHALMTRLGIPHAYADGPLRKHHWESGWLEGAAQSLREMLP